MKNRSGMVLFGLVILTAVIIWYFGDPLTTAESWLAAATLVTFAAFGYDKIMTKAERQRIPEVVLLALTLAGGTPGALAGRWLFRHKTTKPGFRLKFWIIVAVQFLILFFYFGKTRYG